MELPKKAECSDCLEYGAVTWVHMVHGLEAVCAACLVNRKLTVGKIKRSPTLVHGSN